MANENKQNVEKTPEQKPEVKENKKAESVKKSSKAVKAW